MSRRAAAFYNKQMLDHLNPLMREYLSSAGDGVHRHRRCQRRMRLLVPRRSARVRARA